MRAQELSCIKKVTLSGPAGEDDYFCGWRFTMQGHRDLQPIHAGHEQVRYHKSGGNLSELAEPFVPVGCLKDNIPSTL